VISPWILGGRREEGAQPAQKKLPDKHMEKYNLQDQDWRKQFLKKK